MSSETFCFDKNGTYFFISATDLDEVIDKGVYKLNGDTLLLNSDVQPNDLLRIKNWKIPNSDSIYISISLFSGQEIFLTTLIINDTIKYLLTEKEKNGIIKFKNGYVQTLKIQSTFLPWQLSKKTFSLGDNNIIEILIDDTKGFRRAFFTDDKFILKKTLIQSVVDKEYNFTIQPNMKCKE